MDPLLAAVAVPEHKLSESPNSRSIDIYDWTITASTNPISNASELDALQACLGIPLPEMTFGNNYLSLEHRPSGWKYSFTTGRALKEVKNGPLEEGDGGVKVGYADAWLKSRYGFSLVVTRSSSKFIQHSTDPGSALMMPTTVQTKPYDWTYTTTYTGTAASPFEGSSAASTAPLWIPADPNEPSHHIPLAELTRPDPILFYAEVPLFEDELHDNGSSNVLVRIVGSLPCADASS
jgi:type 2A phosphatase activator TIP41